MDTQKLITFLEQQWQGKSCQLCGKGNWNIADRVFELREFQEGHLSLANTPVVPVIPVTCDSCGNTVLINALAVGLTKKGGKHE